MADFMDRVLTAQKESIPLGEQLLKKRALSADQLRIALYEQQSSQEPLGRVLVRLGFVTEATIRDLLSEKGGVNTVDLRTVTVDPEVLAKIPLAVAKQYNVFPIAFRPATNTVVLAVANPNDFVLVDQIRAFLGGDGELEFMVAEESEIARAVDEYYGLELTIEGILREIEIHEMQGHSSAEGNLASDGSANPIVRLVNAFLNDAVKRGASDIHFEPEESFLRVRYRIDGVLRQIRSLHRSYWPSMAVRLKVIADMNIAESRIAQDGRISFTLYGRVVDFRVACQPTAYGENFVLRILDRHRNVIKLENLGLSAAATKLLELIIGRPHGVIMITGPTGSGKTTTLYSIIQHLNTESVNIMTLEDPVEYPLPMIRQTPIGEGGKMDWASGIKSMLRQDPDIMLVGEVREPDTAEQVFRAAMTGHLVLTTLHTNNAIGVIPRLLDMGILPDIMATNISGVIAQRLVRCLCGHCKKPTETLTAQEKTVFAAFAHDLSDYTLYAPVGCPRCDYQGYQGRAAIMEILKFNDLLDEAVANQQTVHHIKEIAENSGVFMPMLASGLDRIVAGETTLQEVGRVVDLTPYWQNNVGDAAAADRRD